MVKILLVEDNPGDARLVELALAEAIPEGAALDRAERLGAALERLATDTYDAVLLDLSLPDSHGLATVRAAREAAPSVPIVVLTGLDDEAVALGALQEGAQDYLPKGTEGAGLARSLRYAVERQHADQELRRARDAADAANRAKNRFLALIGRDVRPPLTGVVGYADLLREGLLGELNPEQADAVDRIAAAADLLLGLLTQVQDLARIEGAGLALAPEPVDLRALLDAVRLDFAAVGAAKGIVLGLDAPDALPPIVADPARLRQIAAILVGNAVKRTDLGAVTLRARVAPGRVEIAVADTGAGIPAANLPLLFAEFAETGAASSPEAGTDVGLAIAKRLVELHGGTIRADSEIGVGSTFVVDLPTAPRPGEC